MIFPKKERYAALTNWRISTTSPMNLKISGISKYIIQIRFPKFFTDFQSALNFSNDIIKTLHYYNREQSLEGVMSVIDIDHEEFNADLPYFTVGTYRKSFNRIDENPVSKSDIAIYYLKKSHPIKSDLSLSEYASLLDDGCEFEKLIASADVINHKF